MARAAALSRTQAARGLAGGGRDPQAAATCAGTAQGGDAAAGCASSCAAGGAADGSVGAGAIPGPASVSGGGASSASTAAAEDVRFVSLAARLRPWIRELEVRATEDPECAAVLVEASQTYWRARRALASGPLTRRLREVVAAEAGAARGEADGRRGGTNAATAVGRCCAEALFACRSEAQLHAAFFTPPPPSAPRPAPPVSPELETLAYPLLDVLRPLVLGLKQVPALCAVVHVLDAEAMPEARRAQAAGGGTGVVDAAAGAAGAALEGLLTRLLGDARERLTFRMQAALRDEVGAILWPCPRAPLPYSPAATTPPPAHAPGATLAIPAWSLYTLSMYNLPSHGIDESIPVPPRTMLRPHLARSCP